MSNPLRERLENLGLSPTEAGIYLILLRNRQALGASAIAARAEMARPSVYPAVTLMMDLGLVESEATYGSGFTAVMPERAMQSLVARKNDELLQCKQLATELTGELKSIIGPPDASEVPESKFVQVLRDARSVAERFERLQLEAKKSVDCFTKAPLFMAPGNPAESRALRRGVRIRGLYEKAILDTPGIKPYLAAWIKHGEEARVYSEELPHKLAIFDEEIVLMPLIWPGEQTRNVFIRHPQLAQTLTVAFEHFWERSEPISALEKTPKTQDAKSRADQPPSRNGRRDQFTKEMKVRGT